MSEGRGYSSNREESSEYEGSRGMSSGRDSSVSVLNISYTKYNSSITESRILQIGGISRGRGGRGRGRRSLDSEANKKPEFEKVVQV